MESYNYDIKSYSNLNYWIKRHSYEIKKFIPDKMYLIF